ncbi:MAG: HEAT repeat domain-containing protein [Bacteroidota bacterium]
MLARKEILSTVSPDRYSVLEMLSALFYIDPLDQPALVPLLDEAISLVAQFGTSIIPALVEKLDAGDLKAQIAFAHALSRIGPDAIKPLIVQYISSKDPARRSFILYALGKIKSPEIVEALPLALEAAHSSILELRDTATRALGKFAESIPPARFPEHERQLCLDRLQKNLADSNAGIRSKAVRSLGKLAKYKHLSPDERTTLKTTCLLILGKDENFEWDRAFVVRKEAEETLKYV